MRKLVLFILFAVCIPANAQIEKIWETNLAMGNDSLEVLFYKQDSAGNHYTGGVIGNNYFISKFNTLGNHLWTRSANEFIEYPLFPTSTDKTIYASWVSDIAFHTSKIYVSGVKCYEGGSCYNFLLNLDENGDSLGFIHVVKEDTAASHIEVSWPELKYQKSFIKVLDGLIYFFSAIRRTKPSEFGFININVFKLDSSLHLLNYRAYDGISTFSYDRIEEVIALDNYQFLIQGIVGETLPRTVVIDSSLNMEWQHVHRVIATAKHSVLSPTVQNSRIYTFSNLRDTSRKDIQSGLGYKIVGHARKYDLSGSLLDSLLLFRSPSSNDSLTDVAVDTEGNIYAASLSKDSGEYRVLITKINSLFEIEKHIVVGENPKDRVQIEVQGCHIYVSFIDSLNTGTILKLLRLDENMNVLTESIYHTGKDKINFLSVIDKQIHILSSGINKAAGIDTLCLKFLADTISIAEPLAFTATAVSPRSIELSWQLSIGLGDSMLIFRSLDSNNWQLLRSVSFLESTYTDSILTPSVKFYYFINSRWQNEYSCNTLFASDSTPFNTSLQPVESPFFQLYPNPVYSELEIKGIEPIEEIEVITTVGETIKRYYHLESIPIMDLLPGTYFIRINGTYTYKILKL